MRVLKVKNALCFTVLVFFFNSSAFSRDRKLVEIRTFPAKEARQGVAVDDRYLYVIDSRQIVKYDKKTGDRIAEWREKENGPIIHLDSGMINDGKLYCAHSNYPQIPMTSSVEIWDAAAMQHIGSHSFGIRYGSCTWIDRHEGFWWAAFGHYEKFKSQTGRGTEWTTVVKFNDQWLALEAWIFPPEVLERLMPMSNSGGSWGSDDLLYCTGHDSTELYVMRLPEAGSVLELIEIVKAPIAGQGIAWDRSDPGFLFGIRRSDGVAVQIQLVIE